MIVLDTDTLTLFLLGHPRIVARSKAATQEVVTTIISRIEMLRGRFDSLMKAADGMQLQAGSARLRQAEVDLSQIKVLPVNAIVAAEFDKLRQDRKVRAIGRADILIASFALAHKCVLVTRNLKHFRQVPGLKVDNWAD